MGVVRNAEREHAEESLRVVNQAIDVLFEPAPVMMHSIDRDGKLVKVNRRWLQTLGYTKGEVLGRKSVEFLTEESRARALKSTLPLFWSVGSAYSIGYQLVKKDGQVIDVLLDAEAGPSNGARGLTHAALRNSYDMEQWEQASTTIKALTELTRERAELKGLLHPVKDDNQHLSLVQQSSEDVDETGLTREVLGALLEGVQDISRSLQGLTRVHEESLEAMAERQHELLDAAKGINKTLLYLADSVADTRPHD